MNPNSPLSRRSFAAVLGSTAALAAQQQPAQAPNPDTSATLTPKRSGTLDDVPPFKEIHFTRQPAALRAQPFPMTQVRLLPSPFLDAAEWNRGYMRRLSADRLLHSFRLTAGLPSTAEPLGGWEIFKAPTPGVRPNSEGELRGHFTGHFLSASAQLFASMGDTEAKAKADYLVAELAKCQQKLGSSGYLSAFPIEWFDRLDARKPVWAPFYTIHKIMAGMLDMYHLAGNQQALDVLKGMSNWADEWSASKTGVHMQNILETEYGGMNEVLYNLAAVTGEDRYAKAGDRFTKKRFFNPLALHRDELTGLHVNTHIPQVIGAARRYELSSDARFKDVAAFFFHEVTTARTYVTEGTSNGEGWLTQPNLLASELKRSVATAECCCSYNMLKLARHLYSWSPEPAYFDYYERALFNHRLGTIQPKTGFTQYYLSLTPGAWKTFNTETNSFWCCTGSGVEEFSKLNDSIYWRDAEGLYVNLFIPSELHWEERGLTLRQETTFPEQAATTLTITAAKSTPLALRLRIPAWTKAASVKLNGRALEVTPTPGSYFTLTRAWKAGDKIELSLPMHLSVEAMPDDPRTQAFLYGPIVLAGDLGSEGLTDAMIVGPNAPQMRRLPIDVPAFKAPSPDPSAWIKPTGAPLTFRTAGQATDVTLAPLNSIFSKRYSVYWQVTS